MSDIDAIFKLFDHYRSDVVDLSRVITSYLTRC